MTKSEGSGHPLKVGSIEDFGRSFCSLSYGSGIPKSRQIFLAKWSDTSLCRGTAERRPIAGLPHHE